MSKFKHDATITSSLQILSGIESETMPDYFGQGALGVYYLSDTTSKPTFHPIKDAYNDIIAQPMDKTNPLCMSTDSNRSEEGNLFPKRTSIEFRSGPTQEHANELLHLIKAYCDWLTQQKKLLVTSQFEQYKKPSRQEQKALHYLSLSHFIDYYNELENTSNKLEITSPQIIFDPKNAGPDFEFRFPNDAQWVLQLNYNDLAPRYAPVFTSQYNLSLPVGCIFDPQVKNSFPMSTEFSLLNQEKEIAADFNESRPHRRFHQYEEQIFKSAIRLADGFFTEKQFPVHAIGAKDFLRGIVYELALISTSQAYLIELFKDDALWIAEQHQKIKVANGEIKRKPNNKEIDEIATSLANTLRKSIFPYFMKATLADFFKQLHPYEQQLLQAIPKNAIKSFCRKAIQISNGGQGNNQDHPGHLMFKHDSFMELFDDFYKQTFQGVLVDPENAPADPIGCLTERFIPSTNIGTKHNPVNALVIELRAPAQGKQQYKDILKLHSQFRAIHAEVLNRFNPIKQTADAGLNALYEPTAPSNNSSAKKGTKRKAQALESKSATVNQSFFNKKEKKPENKLLKTEPINTKRLSLFHSNTINYLNEKNNQPAQKKIKIKN